MMNVAASIETYAGLGTTYKYMLLVVVLFLTACGGAATGSENTPGLGSNDWIDSSTPSDHDTGVGVFDKVTIQFAVDIDPASVNSNHVKAVFLGYQPTPGLIANQPDHNLIQGGCGLCHSQSRLRPSIPQWRTYGSQSPVAIQMQYNAAANSLDITFENALSYAGFYRIELTNIKNRQGETLPDRHVHLTALQNPLLSYSQYLEGDIRHYSEYTVAPEGNLHLSYFIPAGSMGFGRKTLQFYEKDLLNNRGLLQRTVKYHNKGPDQTWFSGDDAILSYTSYQYDAGHRLNQVIEYGSNGLDQQWFNGDDAVTSYARYFYDQNGRLETVLHFRDFGADGEWFTGDDQISGGYTVERFDNGGRRSRIETYNGAGDDGVWHTDDDILQSYEHHLYDSQGRLARVTTYNHPGADERWYSKDDRVESYLSRAYDAMGRLATETRFIDDGPDRLWFNHDDGWVTRNEHQYNDAGKLSEKTVFIQQNGVPLKDEYLLYDYNNRNLLTRIRRLARAQPNAELFEMEFYEKRNYAGNGAMKSQIKFIGAGDDGMWLTDDDERMLEMHFHTDI